MYLRHEVADAHIQQLRDTFSTGAKRWLFVITHASFSLIWKSLTDI